jgi:hypothetical protein
MPVPICSDPSKPLVRSMDLASQLIDAKMRGAKHEVFDMPTNGSDNAATLPTLRSADAPCAQNATVWGIARPVHIRMPEL